MNRRELLTMIMSATGYAMVGSPVLLAGCTSASGARNTGNLSSDPNVSPLIAEIAETIIPRTDTPGAKDAAVAPFMIKIVEDCYDSEDRTVFYQGLEAFRELCQVRFGQDFAELSDQQRTEFLRELDQVARSYPRAPDSPVHYFVMLKQLTLFAYFTSEIVQTQVLRLVPVPGRYDGCYPYQKGDTAWAI
ncbi:gluconate 2-dehydrogenase subunit 3 family protein [Pseudohongiella acticola]|jgi:glucoside 3-dehydrogenase (cytochrome c) hitch-hiker subunit|uniref:gluconate 2-dehydrogenase subunit 3 family protein n=1 Tax=Pseudohongiella acticola TaxID=1524254 RepID=UPI0030EC2E4F